MEAIFRGARNGAVLRALASHQCGPGSITARSRCHMWVEFQLLVLALALRGFSPDTTVFPSLKKTIIAPAGLWPPRRHYSGLRV